MGRGKTSVMLAFLCEKVESCSLVCTSLLDLNVYVEVFGSPHSASVQVVYSSTIDEIPPY